MGMKFPELNDRQRRELECHRKYNITGHRREVCMLCNTGYTMMFIARIKATFCPN